MNHKLIFCVLIFLLFTVTAFARFEMTESEKLALVEEQVTVDRAPEEYASFPVNLTDEIFDLLDNFVPFNQEGEYPVATDGNHIYTARWNSTEFYRYDLDGTYVGEFTIAGAGSLRDMTYDGQYFYASPNSTVIYEMDLANEVLISSISTSVPTIRSIAYDPDHDGFWVGSGWSPTSLQLVNRAGSNVTSLPITTTSISGMAWENVLEDGPHLWAYCQNNNNNDLTQIDLNTGAAVQTFDVTTTGVIPTGATSGGLVITDELVAGKWVFLGIAQNEMIWVLELGDAADPEAPGAPTDFVVTPDAGGALEANISWTNPDIKVNGDPLTELDAIFVYRGDDLIYTDNNPTIGGADNYTDTVTESGIYDYTVLGENSFGEGLPASALTWVGEDVPAAVEDLTAEQTSPDLMSCTLTWTNPSEGLHGGAFNNPILGYHIERSDGETFDLTGIHTEFIDDDIPNAGGWYYTVVPYNSIGDGGSATSNVAMITPEGTAMLGTGTAVHTGTTASPINIYYRSLRGQMVYTAAEINASGVTGAAALYSFGFYVESPPIHALPNFRIQMKHTTATNAATHDPGPYEEVYFDANYMPTSGDYDIITLDEPFIWNGVDNILVDTVFDMVPAYDQSGIVRIYDPPVPDGFRFIRSDSQNYSTNPQPTTTTSDNKPQAIMVFGDPPTGPWIAVDVSEFNVVLPYGTSNTQEMIISNSGGDDLTFDITVGDFPGLITADPSSGTVLPGEQAVIDVTFDADGFTAGTYDTNMVIDHNAQGEDIIIPCHVVIHPEALFLDEDFSGAWPPPGWTTTSTGTNVNWEQSNTNAAGGEEPEARFYWSPSTVATQRLITPELDTSAYTALILEFRNFNNDFSGGYDLRLETTSDGVDWTTFETFPAAAFGPQVEEIIVQTPDVGSETFQIAWTFDGDSWDINWWCIDDVLLFGAEDDGYLEGTVTLVGGTGNVEDVEISANGITTNPNNTGFYSMPLYPGTYDVSASLYGYQTETVTGVLIEEDETTVVDFDLGNIDIDVTPANFNVTIDPGEIITETMTITNDGAGDLEYSISVQQDESRVLGFRTRNTRTKANQPITNRISDLSGSDRDPRPSYASYTEPTDDIFDLIDWFPVGVGGGEYSVTTNGDHIYTAAWNSTGFYRYETDGTYIGEFTIAGAGNLRDLTYDGEYFYGSPNSNTIYELDLAGESLISSFSTTATSSVRGIAYDPDHDGFWVSNGWDPPLTLIDRNGTTISTITTTASSFSGLGWENVTDGGPHLWAYTQELGTEQNNLVQIDITNGSTIQTFDVTTHGIIAGDAISGGMDITDELIPGLWTFIGTSQNDVIWIIELGDSGPLWLYTDPVSGIVPTGESVDIDVIFDATDPELEPGLHTAEIVVNHNAPEDPVVVPANMAVAAGPIISVDPESFDVSLLPEETLVEELIISNIGGEDLTYDIVVDEALRQASVGRDRLSINATKARLTTRERVDWLSVDPDSGTLVPGDSDVIGITFDAADLAPDTYYATIIITNNAGDPVEIPVSMEVEVPELPMPTNLDVVENTGEFSWSPPDYDPPLELVEYEVYLGDTHVATTEDTEYQFEDLINGQTYIAGVLAVYNWGDSELATTEFTYIGVGADELIPTVTELRGNYPNPFNPDTNIRFSLNKAGRVRIDIFNIKGEKVRTLLDSNLNAAHHEVVWDGRDGRGRNVSSGIFFYRMDTEDYTSVKKMLLMK